MLTKTDKFVMWLMDFATLFLAYMTTIRDYPMWLKMLFILIAVCTNSVTSYLKGALDR